jgi:uncharacterized protein YbjT (DUF2867 family)
MKFAVTGASGYIGACFIKCAIASGHQIVALSRRPLEPITSDWIPYELSSNQAPVLPTDTDVVLHLATSTSPDERLNSAQEVFATELIIKAARDIGARFIFVSSQTARSDAPTAYGRTKWQIEQIVLASAGWVVRSGQVYGGAPRGLFGELVKIVRRLAVLPAFLPAPMVQPIHVNDLAFGLLKIAEHKEIAPRVLCLASPTPVTFTEFLCAIACDRLRLWRSFVPVPTLIISAGIRLVGKKPGLERLRSLFELPAMDSESDLRSLELQLRPLASGMHPTGDDRSRQLFLEGRSFLSYVLKVRPGGAALRRYVRAVDNLRGGKALGLPKPFVRWPALLALIDGNDGAETTWKKEFLLRLDAATLLAEATPLGARRFSGLGEPHGFLRSMSGLVRAAMAEASWRVLSVLFGPVCRCMLPRSLEQHQ